MRFSAQWRGEVRQVAITASQRVIPPKTLGGILYQAGLWPEEFEALVEGREIQE